MSVAVRLPFLAAIHLQQAGRYPKATRLIV